MGLSAQFAPLGTLIGRTDGDMMLGARKHPLAESRPGRHRRWRRHSTGEEVALLGAKVTRNPRRVGHGAGTTSYEVPARYPRYRATGERRHHC